MRTVFGIFRMCDRDETLSVDQRGPMGGGYVAVLEGFFKTSDEAALIRLCRLVWSILPTLTIYSRESICAQAVVPCLTNMCERVLRRDPPNLLTGMIHQDSDKPGEIHQVEESRDMKLLNSLLGLVTAGLHGEIGYEAMMSLFCPFGELLFYCPDTQKNFMHILKAGALLESQLATATPTTAVGEQIRSNEWPLNR